MKTHIKSSLGTQVLKWKSIPRGQEGSAWVEIGPETAIEVRWRVDAQGIWIETADGVSGFDLKAELDDSGQKLYQVSKRNSHLEWQGVSVQVGESNTQQTSRSAQAKVTRVKAQMPGKMIRVLIQVDQQVEKDQPLMVMEAMKMENEIRAPIAGKITQLHVIEGQAVESGAELLRIEP